MAKSFNSVAMANSFNSVAMTNSLKCAAMANLFGIFFKTHTSNCIKQTQNYV